MHLPLIARAFCGGLATCCVIIGPRLSFDPWFDSCPVSCGAVLAAEPLQPREAAVFIESYCIDCHSGSSPEGDVALATLEWDAERLDSFVAERVVRRLETRQMPPADAQRPSETEYQRFLEHLTEQLDNRYGPTSDPGRPPAMRRLSRTEYGNAIRDLLALNVDVERWLPADESSHGFDNISVGELSPVRLQRYLTAAQRIGRLAVGLTPESPRGDTFRVQPDVTQEQHVRGLPLGTRGGLSIAYTFPSDGEYRANVRLARDRNEEVEGLSETHQVLLLLDRNELERFTVQPPGGPDHSRVDAHLDHRFEAKAGPHRVQVTFLETDNALSETMRQPFDARFNRHRHPRRSPAIYEVTITGPYHQTDGEAPASDSGPAATHRGQGHTPLAETTPSRQRIFSSYPQAPSEEAECAEEILLDLARQAFRRPVTVNDIEQPLKLYRQARRSGQSYEEGIAGGLSGILASPHFLFRIERQPEAIAAGDSYLISGPELASRLSFFIWSSLPDERLLQLAESDRLHDPQILEAEVERMLADPRANSLATNFAAQWLRLKNLDSVTPDMRAYPDFDDNLRQALRRETELLFENMVTHDLSVLELLDADYTFLNERLAKHYGVAHVFGSRFRRVNDLPADALRGGMLRHGSILTVTSYATRTSPVIRGNWILENLVGSPPPPPPPDIPDLAKNTVDSNLTVRERLAVHRNHAGCAVCHDMMDPIGFLLEEYDAIGQLRQLEDEQPIDASGSFVGQQHLEGVTGLEGALRDRHDLFVQTMTEKLMTYALGRGVEHFDAPAVRRIMATAADEDFRFLAIVRGIVLSRPFQYRRAE